MGLSLQASNSKHSQEGRTSDDFPNLFVEMKMGTAMIEEHIEVTQIIKSRVIIWSSYFTNGFIVKVKLVCWRYICRLMIIVVLLATAKIWISLDPLMDKRMRKWDMKGMKNYDPYWIFFPIWMTIEYFRYNKKGTERQIPCDLNYMWNPQSWAQK